MALTDDNSMVMPVAPMYGGNNGGFGGFGGDWGWIVLLLLLAGGGMWGGYGGFGGGFGNMYEFPWLLNGQNSINANTNAGFNNAAVMDGLTSVRDGISGLSTQLCNSSAGITQSINNGFANAEVAANARQIADMQTAFAGQTAMSNGFNSVQAQLAQCCCDNRLATNDVKYTIATEACANRATSTANTQAILDKLCQLELDNAKAQIEAKNDTIAQLRSEVLYARGQASQDVQTAAIQAGQRALANEVEAYVAPRAIPAYVVQNPNCCTNSCGCGCNY